MQLTDVSKTALYTLRSHVIESEKINPLIDNPMAGYGLKRLYSFASKEEKSLIFNRKLPRSFTNHIALRARKYDQIANDYISSHPGCIVINLGCGFDTRYWRINHEKCTYFEFDLPEIIQMKKDILKEYLNYELIACSVLDDSWIDLLASKSNKHILFLAEGVMMFLPKEEIIKFFKALSTNFYQSQIVLEVVTEKYTHGIWKKIIQRKIKRLLALDAGTSYQFGVKNAIEIQSYNKGIKVIDEWSYVEDPDMYPRILKYMRISRTQWTVTATINEK